MVDLSKIAERIDAFEAECLAAAYTDTGDAWDLLAWIRNTIMETV